MESCSQRLERNRRTTNPSDRSFFRAKSFKLVPTSMQMAGLLCLLLFSWEWLSAEAAFDGEAFLKEDMADATQFQSFLKDKGVEPVKAERRAAEQGTLHKKRRRRPRRGDDEEDATPATRPAAADPGAASGGAEVAASEYGQPDWVSMTGPVHHNYPNKAPAGCKRVYWLLPIHKEWDMPETQAQALHTKMQVALLSARVHAPSLVPVLVYDGAPDAFTAWWETSGGQVVFTYTSVYDQLASSRGSWADSEAFTRMCRGSFLYLDIPQIMTWLAPTAADDVGTEYAFVTGTDILFLKDLDSCQLGTPEVMSVGRDHQDSGGLSIDVAYINVVGYGKYYKKLVRAAAENNWDYANCAQGLITSYFDEKSLDILPNPFQWKGYWGGGPDVALVQFYGPQPLDCLPCLVEYPEEVPLCAQRCDKTSRALFRFTPDKGVYYKWLMHVYWAFIETPVKFIEYNP